MKKFLRIIAWSLVCCLLCACFAACGKNGDQNGGSGEGDAPADNSQVFDLGGMSVKLTKDFKKQDLQGYTAGYVDEKNTVVVFVLQEKFILLEGFEDWTLNQYANAVASNAPTKGASVKAEDGITYFEYQFTNPQLNIEYYYYTTVFKDTDCFWTVQFSCLAKDRAEMRPTFIEYAKSVDLG